MSFTATPPSLFERSSSILIAINIPVFLILGLLLELSPNSIGGRGNTSFTSITISKPNVESESEKETEGNAKSAPLSLQINQPDMEVKNISSSLHIDKIAAPSISITVRPVTSKVSNAEPTAHQISVGTSARSEDCRSNLMCREAGAASASIHDAAQSSGPQDRYGKVVYQSILAEQRYEGVLRRQKLEGTVVISFTLGGRGDLRSAHIVESSGEEAIDRLGLRHLHAAAPFPRPPNAERRQFVIPLTYRQAG